MENVRYVQIIARDFGLEDSNPLLLFRPLSPYFLLSPKTKCFWLEFQCIKASWTILVSFPYFLFIFWFCYLN